MSIILAFFIYNFSLILSRPGFYQWDFKTFYYAAKAHACRPQPLRRDFSFRDGQKTDRVPVSLSSADALVFSVFFFILISTQPIISSLPSSVACWRACFSSGQRFFLKREADIWFYPFALLAFNTSIFVDIAAGNISIFEQFGLWLGFFFLLKRRLFLFCLAIVLIANFKITPLFFLVLLLFINDKKKYLYFFASLFTFGMIQAVYYFFSPLYQDFLIFGLQLEKGWGNPSSFSLLRTLISGLAPRTGRCHILCPSRWRLCRFCGPSYLVISWRAVRALKSGLSLSGRREATRDDPSRLSSPMRSSFRGLSPIPR